MYRREGENFESSGLVASKRKDWKTLLFAMWMSLVISIDLSIGPWGLVNMVRNGPASLQGSPHQMSNKAAQEYEDQWFAESAAEDRQILWASSGTGTALFIAAVVIAALLLRTGAPSVRLQALVCLAFALMLVIYAFVHSSAVYRGSGFSAMSRQLAAPMCSIGGLTGGSTLAFFSVLGASGSPTADSNTMATAGSLRRLSR